jgi:hypothetical protein
VGDFRLGRGAKFELADGLTPEQVVIVVDGKASLSSSAHVSGTLFTAKGIVAGRDSVIDGALIGGRDIRLGRNARVSLHPFVGL